MEIHYSTTFKKNFKKRILTNVAVAKRCQERLGLFIRDKANPLLRDHKLIGELQHYRAFSIKGDLRVIYFQESEDIVAFIDIGTHNQVYQ